MTSRLVYRVALWDFLGGGGGLRLYHGQNSDDARGIFKKRHFNISIYRPQIPFFPSLFLSLSLSLSHWVCNLLPIG